MDHGDERRAVVTAVFAATGKKVDEDDPIIVAALFHAYTMREASCQAADQIAEAGQAVKLVVGDARKLALEAGNVMRQAALGEKKRMDALEARIARAIRAGSRNQAVDDGPPTGWRGVMAGLVMGVVVAGGVLSIACGFSYSWIGDARIGADFRRAVPTMDPSLRDKLMDHLEKRRGSG